MKIVSYSISCKDDDVPALEDAIAAHMEDLGVGLLHFGTSVREPTEDEKQQILDCIPEELLTEETDYGKD